MLTLKQLLESDSLATIVAKLNQNFQVISNSNGGPQGIRGPQGIPGLPGKMGPIGPTGEQGPTGTIIGIVPYAPAVYQPGIGPAVDNFSPYGKIGPWPQSSYEWLLAYYSNGYNGGSGQTPTAGDVFIDHRNNGYWKFLTAPDVDGASYTGYTTGNPYQYYANASYTYPDLGNGLAGPQPDAGFFTQAGWYFYPTIDSSALGLGNVWVEDYTSYLVSNLGGVNGAGPYGPTGPFDGSSATPLKIPNARLVSKYGSVWITSGNDATDGLSDGDLKTSTIGKWGWGPGVTNTQPGRYNAGIDRLLFKMSLDGLSYYDNVTARGYTGPATMASKVADSTILASEDYPIDDAGNDFATTPANFWVKPQYEVTLDDYSPLLFLSHRNDADTTEGTYGTLGIYMFTDTGTDDPNVEIVAPQPSNPYVGGTGELYDNNVSKTLHLFTSRFAPDPMVLWENSNQPLNSAKTYNFGEMILDFRRIIASNQYVCSIPTDLKLSSDYRTTISGVLSYKEDDNSNVFKYRTHQGYVSAINGKSNTGNSTSPYYWEYGLGDGSPGINASAGIHDNVSGTTGMLTRRTWYGSSVLNTEQFLGTAPGSNEYIRVAGMMERGRRFYSTTAAGGGSTTGGSHFLSELIFYTSHFKVDSINSGTPITNNNVEPENNEHKSLPAFYISPYRNIGIGTFVGTNGANDLGPLEPLAKLHVHVKENLREDDPTFTYYTNAVGANSYSTLPTKVYAAAAFSGQVAASGSGRKGLTDILLGNVSILSRENVVPSGNVVNVTSIERFRNALRTESWSTSTISSMHLGAQPYAMNLSIGRNGVEAYSKEFQISLSPLNTTVTSGVGLNANTGVGIHNLYPRTRFHMYGKNVYNEIENGQEVWTPGYSVVANPGLTVQSTYPYYGLSTTNLPSSNQVSIDYLGSTYNYPVGIYEYQYYVFAAAGPVNLSNPSVTGIASANAAVYPTRDIKSPTRFAVPYEVNFNNFAYPSTNSSAVSNNSYKHGGAENALWDASSYIGFNLYRDLSSANGGVSTGQNVNGDDRDTARWILGTQGATGPNGHGNNGGAAIMASSQGEIGIVTIPRGRDGGRVYEQWEQRGLGTRDVLNNMKIVFDKYGNIAIGNAAGWDPDAYASLEMDPATGKVYYLPNANATSELPRTASSPDKNTSLTKYGLVTYVGYPETPTVSSAAYINKNATRQDYIRLEVAAEKAWSRDGRATSKSGFGYPAGVTITLNGSDVSKYINANFTGLAYAPTFSGWVIRTDLDGRIVSSVITYTLPPTPNTEWALGPITASNYNAIVYPHPTEFNVGGPLHSKISASYPTFTAAPGSIAAEWGGMNNDFNGPEITTISGTINSGGGGNFTQIQISPAFTPITRGSANVRLNNFVYGEGFGFSGGSNQATTNVGTVITAKRQESPKLILTFLEKTPTTSRTTSGLQPYKKVNTVIQSAQNEASLREYWIPKTDNTGGTFMVFTDHFGKKEKDNSFSDSPINSGTGTFEGNADQRAGLHLEEVVTQEFLAGYTGTGITPMTVSTVNDKTFLNQNADGLPIDLFPGYVRYYNTTYTYPNQPTVFSSATVAELVDIAPPVSGATTTITRTGSSAKILPKSHYVIANPGGQIPELTVTYLRTVLYGTQSPTQVTSAGACESGDHTKYIKWEDNVTWNPTDSDENTASVAGNSSSWWTGSSGKITIPSGYGGTYTLTYTDSAYVAPTVSIAPATDCTPDMGFTNAAYSANISRKILRNGAVLANITGAGNVTVTLAAGDEIEVEATYTALITAQSDGTYYCTCSTVRGDSFIKNIAYSYSGSLNIKKAASATCPTTPTDGIAKVGMGRTSVVPFGVFTAISKPINSNFVCPAHVLVNVDDNYEAVGAQTGSVVNINLANPDNIVFDRKNITSLGFTDWDRVKIRINLSARTPNNDNYYTDNNRDLVFRLLPASGAAGTSSIPAPTSNFTLSKFTDGDNLYVQPDNSVIYAVFPGKQTSIQVQPVPAVNPTNININTYVYDGYAELVFPRALWESSPSWALCAAFLYRDPQPIGQTMNSSNWEQANDNNQDVWDIDKLSIEFIVLGKGDSGAASSSTESIPTAASGANRASIRRNIDKFYELFTPGTNYDTGWGRPNDVKNPATAIRMKRINSEFALVDYNITVKVTNPWLGTGNSAVNSLIDFSSPRFTQYLRFVYIPDESFWNDPEYGQDFAQELYGNGMWLSNWSSYKNWYPGTAIVGDDISNTTFGGFSQSSAIGQKSLYDGADTGGNPLNISSDWSPSFYDNALPSIASTQPFYRGWNGNILEMLSFKAATSFQEMSVLRGSSNYGILTSPLNYVNNAATQNNISEGQSVLSAFGNDGRTLRQAQLLFNWSNYTGSIDTTRRVLKGKQQSFVGYLGAMYALWGNQAFERNTNTQWRLSPTYSYTVDSTALSSNIQNNGFILEVQFSKPILHTDIPLGGGYYGFPTGVGSQQVVVQPYRYLTVSGQAIVRYAETYKTAVPATIPGGPPVGGGSASGNSSATAVPESFVGAV